MRALSLRVLRPVHPIVDRRVELELERRTLKRLAGLAGSTALGPMRPYFVRPARSVGDAAVKRLYRQPALRALADQCVEAPAEPIHLDDVARPDSLESHRRKRTREPGALPPARPPAFAPPPSNAVDGASSGPIISESARVFT